MQPSVPESTLAGLATRGDLQAELAESLRCALREHRTPAVIWLTVAEPDASSESVVDLRLCAERITARLSDGDVLAFAGGRDFAVLVDSVGDAAEAAAVADGLLDGFRRPFLNVSGATSATVSAGVAVYPTDGDGPASLLSTAHETALRAAETGTRLAFADAALDGAARRDRQMQADLDRALEHGEFSLDFQPILNMSGMPVAMEALIRWRHPSRGVVAPLDFIPVAERTGQIVAIGEWVLREACRQAAMWQRSGMPLRVAVNFSAAQLNSPQLVEGIARTLRSSGLDPTLLEIELTESVFAAPDTAAEILNRVHVLGVRVAIDDFGTGFSSLSYLTRLPIDTIKIDRAFVGELTEDTDAAAVVSAVIAMAHQLGLETVAEGVETDEQARFLSTKGCDLVQGFLYSRPLPSADCHRWIRARWRISAAHKPTPIRPEPRRNNRPELRLARI
jgi:EAL domain-containing protein (putative c-di-GMP-specific phosphodiesterase class I)